MSQMSDSAVKFHIFPNLACTVQLISTHDIRDFGRGGIETNCLKFITSIELDFMY